jgi:4-azaleucine resistance transporter AzlC
VGSWSGPVGSYSVAGAFRHSGRPAFRGAAPKLFVTPVTSVRLDEHDLDVFTISNVRAVWRTLGGRLVRDILTVVVATGFVGVSYGAIAVAAGVPVWAVVAFSVFVFAGGSQFLAVSLVAAGSPVAAVLGGLLLNARHLPFGLTIGDVFGRSWARRLLGSHIMVDEAVAFALAQPDLPRRRAAYWFTSIALFICWQIGTLLGVVVGSNVTDPSRFGIDAAFPAAILLLILPRLREAAGLRVALVAVVVAVLAALVLPAGLPVLLGLLGLLAVGRHPDPPESPRSPTPAAVSEGAP